VDKNKSIYVTVKANLGNIRESEGACAYICGEYDAIQTEVSECGAVGEFSGTNVEIWWRSGADHMKLFLTSFRTARVQVTQKY